MTTRTTTEVVRFRASFSLPGLDESWPAGDYAVTTDEELLDTSFPAYRRVATRIVIQSGGVSQHVAIDPLELAAALERDRAGES